MTEQSNFPDLAAGLGCTKIAGFSGKTYFLSNEAFSFSSFLFLSSSYK